MAVLTISGKPEIFQTLPLKPYSLSSKKGANFNPLFPEKESDAAGRFSGSIKAFLRTTIPV
jgi:hypothetical protein